MKSENRKYRVELGINLNAAPVPQTNPNLRIFPLQHALVDITDGNHDEAKAAWYTCLGTGDKISFRLVDITHLRAPTWETNYPKFALAKCYFTNPVTGQPANPFTQQILEWRISERLDDKRSPVFSLNSKDRLPSWNLLGVNAEGEELKSLRFADFFENDAGDEDEDGAFTKFRAFELTVVIKMVEEGWVNHYVFDPEMIVSETDNEGDQSGGGAGK